MAFRYLIFLAISAAAFSCEAGRYGIGDNVTREKVLELVPGRTTKTQIESIFGWPDTVTQPESGVVQYTYIHDRNCSARWFLVPGYLLYNPNIKFSGTRILIATFEGEMLTSFFASDGNLVVSRSIEDRRRLQQFPAAPRK